MGKRQEKRLSLAGQIEIIIDDKEKKIYGEILNITSRAMAFMITAKLKLEANHFFSFILSNEEDQLKNIKGHIIRQEKIGDEYLTVLCFNNISNVEMLVISKFIEKNT
ncbi:MAG: PilZ domain-containing protein [bacterium]|nr:PilZ domain-containing protein [bacterium]